MTSVNKGSGKVTCTVDPGACRFKTKIMACCTDMVVRYEIVSDCPHVKKLSSLVAEGMDPFKVLKMPYSSNPVYEAAGKTLAHSACPVPSALIKCTEAASGLGLKRNVKFEFES